MSLMFPGNTVMGVREATFRRVWVAKLWQAMAKTGKGYPKPSTRHTGIGEDRRQDKLGGFNTSKLARRLLLPTQTA